MSMPSVQSSASTLPSSSTTRVPKNTLGKDDFLSLLVTQMKNQNPLDPMNGTDFAAQLAQFSSLEQLTNINTNLQQSLSANAMLSTSINNALSATFIGKDVRATGNAFHFSNTGNVTLGYSLTAAAKNVDVKIYDDAGNLVKTLTGPTANGENSLTWDGTNDKGQTVGSGNYTFKVEATDAGGASIDSTSYLYGKVSGVRFKSDGAVFVIDGIEVPLSDILEITEG